MRSLAIAGAAHQHVDYAFQELDARDELTLVGISDESAEVAERYGVPRGAPTFTDHREMLRAVRPEIVVAAGAYGGRSAVIVDALDAGCHVVADKPLCTTAAGLEDIRAATRRTRGALTLMLNKRFDPVTVAALDLVRSGTLGTIVEINATGPHKLTPADRPDWYFDRDAYGGILNDLLTHDIDVALQLTGAESGTVSGVVAGALPDTPGFPLTGVATIRAKNQIMVLEVNWLTPAMSALHGDYYMRVIGTEGVADLWFARNRLTVTTARQASHELALLPERRPAEPFFDALMAGEVPTMVDPDCFLVTRLALTAQESAESGGAAIPWSRGGGGR